MLLHCGADKATLDQVRQVPVPAATDTYFPVAYADLITHVQARATELLGLTLRSEQYALNRGGREMFALQTFQTERADNGLAVGLRGSYGKTVAPALAVGASVFICDNLAISGDAVHMVRKSTKNAWRDITAKLDGALNQASVAYREVNADMDHWKQIPLVEDDGYRVLGLAQGTSLLMPHQANVAFGDWRKPRHEAFAARNAYSLYNCVTEALKKGTAGGRISRQAHAHDWFLRVFGGPERALKDASVAEARLDIRDLNGTHFRGVVMDAVEEARAAGALSGDAVLELLAQDYDGVELHSSDIIETAELFGLPAQVTVG